MTARLDVDRLPALLERLDLPCFLYDPAVLAANIAAVRAVFPRYHYPVKCNPHPELVRTAIAAGAELDLCSMADLDIAIAAGAPLPRTSYTGVGLTGEMLARLSASGCRVNLNSLDEVAGWARQSSSRACGVRVGLTDGAYSLKFGLSPAEIEQARDLVRIDGLHVHDSHRGRTASEAAGVLGAAIDAIASHVVRDLRYVCLGGGWPHAYENENPWDLTELAVAIDERIVAPMRQRGFSGEVLVEPGELVVAGAGVWLSRVVSVRKTESEHVVIVDTPTPVPCGDFSYPIRLLRGDGFVRDGNEVVCTIYGSSNSGRDRIRRTFVAEPRLGDVLAVCDTGAYVHSLISPFNERRPPALYVLPL